MIVAIAAAEIAFWVLLLGGLALRYLGVSIAFGPSLIRRVDSWFRHRDADGPRPVRPPKGSAAEVRAVWLEWLRVLLTALVSSAALLGMLALAGWHVPADLPAAAQHPYWATLLLLGIVTTVWFLAGRGHDSTTPTLRQEAP